ncbi:tyrosine-type recombinase/integrase [Brevibacterium otitidis]|uniref:Tyrosine-type recombinase/integrase n=1 Tax=Brevibacterium otitidis TaxID=53364 RepID=A0ABV5WY41_9MICO|nr:hypothetical protein GCM10023233_14150 [Brevibacterium otitidis]
MRHDRPYPPRRIVAAVDVLLGTGMRLGELLALTWDDVDLDAVPAVIEVSGTLTRDADTRELFRQGLPKTDRSERELFLPAFTTASLRKWREEASPHTQIVFPGATGKWRDGSSFRKHLNEVAALAGLGRVNPHKLRRTVATAVYRAESLKHAGAQLGHSELGVTSKHHVARSNRGPVEVVGILDELVTAEL